MVAGLKSIAGYATPSEAMRQEGAIITMLEPATEHHQREGLHPRIIVPLIVGGLPFLVISGLLMVDIDAAAAWARDGWLIGTVKTSFFVGAFIYPLVYIPCAIAAAWKANRQEAGFAFKMSIAPVVLLSVLAVLFLAWYRPHP